VRDPKPIYVHKAPNTSAVGEEPRAPVAHRVPGGLPECSEGGGEGGVCVGILLLCDFLNAHLFSCSSSSSSESKSLNSIRLRINLTRGDSEDSNSICM